MRARRRITFLLVQDNGGSFKGWEPVVITEEWDQSEQSYEPVDYHFGALVALKRQAAEELRGARAAVAVHLGLAALGGSAP